MVFRPHPPIPDMPGIKVPLEANTDVGREAFTDQAETVCSLGLWSRVNRRRRVCGLVPLTKHQRSAKELAAGLLEMRDLWVKGEDWNQQQPGDDPALVQFLSWVDYPMPRTVLARISYEGIAVPQEIRIPKMDLDKVDKSFANYFYYPKHKDTTKPCIVQRGDSQETIFQVTGSHGLVVNQVVDVYWRMPHDPTFAAQNYGVGSGGGMPRGGCRNQASITKIDGAYVTISGGVGDDFPPKDSHACILTDPDDTIKIYIWRLDSNPTCAGVARVCDRMKYTATARELNERYDPRLAEVYNQEYAGNTQGTGNTMNQWFNARTGYGTRTEINEQLYFERYDSVYRNGALKHKRFTDLETGQSIRAILAEDSPGIGSFEDYSWKIVPVRGLYLTGITWPGIEYGTGQLDDRNFPYWQKIHDTNLSEAVNASTTVLPIVSAQTIPLSGSYKLQIDDEIVLMSGTFTPPVSGSPVVYVTRGHAGTTPTPHASGALVRFIDKTDFPDLFESTENWNNPILSDLPFSTSWMRDYATSGLANYAQAGIGSGYATTQEYHNADTKRTFVVDGTWLCPNDVFNVTILAWGAGGGGGELGGGGGGAFSRRLNTLVEPGTTYTIRVGRGGAGSTTGQGEAGGDSEFIHSASINEGSVKAKGGEGGCSRTAGGIARGGLATSGLGDSLYNGGTGSTQGAGGGSGKDCNGNNAVGLIAGEAFYESGQGGDATQTATSPGGGGGAGQSGGNGRVVIIEWRSVSIRNQSYTAAPDWLPYSLETPAIGISTAYNRPFIPDNWPVSLGASPYTRVSLSLPSYWVPIDIDRSGHSYRTGEAIILRRNPNPLDNVSINRPTHTTEAILFTPAWSNEVERLADSFLINRTPSIMELDPSVNYRSKETIFVGRQYHEAHYEEIATHPDNLMIAMCGMGPNPLRADLNVGWTNVLVEFNMMAAVGYPILLEYIHGFKERRANVSVNGHGVSDFEFNKPEYGEFGAEVYVWRRRFSKKTIKRVGGGVFDASVEKYKEFGSLLWHAGITLNSPHEDKETTLVTWASLEATADVETTDFTMDHDLVKWDNQVIAAGIPEFIDLAQNVPQNYVTTLADLVPGTIYSMNTNFTDYYVPFIKYNFNDENTGHEDNDGLPVGARQNAQTT
jgi:hypothetical protein